MKPRKKGSGGVVFAFMFLLAAVFLSLHGAGAISDLYEVYAVPKGVEVINVFFDSLSVRLLDPFNFEWNMYSQNWLLCGLLIWFLTVATIATSKRTYISGKEYGTARWGVPREISDLLAKNILRKELRKAGLSRYGITRWYAKRSALKEAARGGKELLNMKMADLAEQERSRKEAGRGNKRLYRADKALIRQQVSDAVKAARLEPWRPLKIKGIYEFTVHDLRTSPRYAHLTPGELGAEVRKAARRCKDDLAEFYKGKGRKSALREKYKDSDSILTGSERACIYNLKVNSNTLVIGGSGAGKTRGFVLPNLLQAHTSFVVTDPKGEILMKCGRFLSEYRGYDIRVLNLDNMSRSDGYNPFVYIRPEREGYEERVRKLIKTIIINTDGGEKRNSADPFWEKAEELFLLAIFFFACDGFIEEERNMNTVLMLIAMLKIEEERDNCNSELDLFAKVFEKSNGKGHIGLQYFNEFRSKASGKTAKSIVISAVARLAPFNTAAVKRIFSYDSMNLEELGEKKMAIFVVVPPTNKDYGFIAGMLFQQIFSELQYCAAEKYKYHGQVLPVHVRFILDEFANTCTIPDFLQILAYARSFGISIAPILQSLEQIKNMYKDEWGVIIDNCASRLFLGGVSNMDTLEYVSKMLGKATFDKRTSGRTYGIRGSSSHNYDKVGRELLDPSELAKLPKDDCLLFISGRNPFYSKKYDYTKHPNYRFTSDGNASYAYAHRPYPAPRAAVGPDGRPHREDGVQAGKADYTDAAVMPDCDQVTVGTATHEVVYRVAENLQHFVFSDDSLCAVNDGEPRLTVDDLDRVFGDSGETAAAMAMLKAVADMEYDQVRANNALPDIARGVIGGFEHLVPCPDALCDVPDGEPKFTKREADTFEGILSGAHFDGAAAEIAFSEYERTLAGLDSVIGILDEMALPGSPGGIDFDYNIVRPGAAGR